MPVKGISQATHELDEIVARVWLIHFHVDNRLEALYQATGTFQNGPLQAFNIDLQQP